MKFIIILFLSIFLNIDTIAQVYSSMSFNIRYDNESDGINKWNNRKEELIDLLNANKPDFLGIQPNID